MELNTLIGHLCIAANKAEIELTAVQLERMASALGPELVRDVAKSSITVDIPAKRKIGDVEIVPFKATKPMTDSKIESVAAPAETPAPEPAPPAKVSKPKAVKEKASGKLTPRENQMWNFVQLHPGASMDEICAGMGIKIDNYYFLKRKLKEKGYIITADTGNKNVKKHGRNTLKNLGNIHQEEKKEFDKRMEDAYMGEHMNIQPEPVKRTPVSEKARQLYEYMKSHPDSRMPKTCEDLNITNAEYYMLKAQLKKNGWIESAVENVQAY